MSVGQVMEPLPVGQPMQQQQQPQFVSTSEPQQSVPEGEFAHFECRLLPLGDPSMQTEWLKDGRPLTAGSRFYTSFDRGCVQLDILYTHTEDSGQYSCLATNAFGQAQSLPMQLAIVPEDSPIFDSRAPHEMSQENFVADSAEDSATPQSPPQFSMALAPVSVQENQPAHFETIVQPSADPNVQVEWLKNGTPVTLGSRVRATYERGYATLELLYCYPEDSGSYTCMATNRLGSVQSNAAELSCSGTAGVVTTSALSEASAQNIRRLEEFGEEFNPMVQQQQVQEAPKFVSAVSPAQLEVKENTPATFEVQVSPGSGNRVEVQWLRDGQPVLTGSRVNASLEMGVATLDIYYAYAEDSGCYTAVVSSEFGQDQSSQAVLNCKAEGRVVTASQLPGNAEESIKNLMLLEEELGRPRGQLEEAAEETSAPQIAKQPEPLPEVNENDQVYIELQVQQTEDSTVSVEWMKDGHAINHGSRFRMEFEKGVASLHILYCYAEDSGEYWALVTNRWGQCESERVRVVCSPADSIVTQSQLPGSSQGFQRLEEMEKQWREAPVSQDLQFTQLEEPQSPPSFDIPPQAATVCESHPAKFLVKVGGNPRPRVSWYLNELMIASTSNYKIYSDGSINYLEILRCKEVGSISVKAVAKSQLGEAVAEAELNVVPAEDFRPELKHVQLENNFKRILELKKVERSQELESKIAKPKASIIEFRKVERESELKSRLFRDPEVEEAEQLYTNTQAGLKGGHYAGLIETQEMHEMQLQQHKEQMMAQMRQAEGQQQQQQQQQRQQQQQQQQRQQQQQQQQQPQQQAFATENSETAFTIQL